MVWKLQAFAVFSVSNETKFEVDTTSIILSYKFKGIIYILLITNILKDASKTPHSKISKIVF